MLGVQDGTEQGRLNPSQKRDSGEQEFPKHRKRERAFQDREHGAEPRRHGTAWPHGSAQTHGEEGAVRARGGGLRPALRHAGVTPLRPAWAARHGCRQDLGWMLCSVRFELNPDQLDGVLAGGAGHF